MNKDQPSRRGYQQSPLPFALIFSLAFISSGLSQLAPHWWVSQGKIEVLENQMFRLSAGDTPVVAITPLQPDSTYPRLRIEWAFQLEHWKTNQSKLLLLIGTDSLQVIRLWAGGYDAQQQAIFYGVLHASHATPFFSLQPQVRKSVTLIPVQKKLYIKWVIAAEGKSQIEINGVPLSMPAPLMPWHITYLGIFIAQSEVRFASPQIHWESR